MLQNNTESVAIHTEILYLFHSKRKFSDKSPFDFCVSYIFILCICKMQSTENWFGYLIKLKNYDHIQGTSRSAKVCKITQRD